MPGQAAAQHSVRDLLRELRPVALKILGRHRIPPQDAEDILQDTFLAFVEKRDEVRDPPAWIQGTLRNRCRLYWRERRRRQFVCLDRALENALGRQRPPTQEQIEHRHDVEHLIGEVSSVCQQAIALRYLEGWSYDDTARHLGYKPSGIYKVLERCLAALCTALVGGR